MTGNAIVEGKESFDSVKPKFSDLLAAPNIRERWEKVRRYFFLRESTYDMTNRCNIRCDGCYYYEGDKQFASENLNTEDWRNLMRTEKKRGITYVVLAGAEPSLVPELFESFVENAAEASPPTDLKNPESVGYKIHISVWETMKQTGGQKGKKSFKKANRKLPGR